MMALGWFLIGDLQKTMTFMHQAEKVGASFERVDPQLAALANSNEYQRAKERQNQ